MKHGVKLETLSWVDAEQYFATDPLCQPSGISSLRRAM